MIDTVNSNASKLQSVLNKLGPEKLCTFIVSVEIEPRFVGREKRDVLIFQAIPFASFPHLVKSGVTI
jgi:hypothetical protein